MRIIAGKFRRIELTSPESIRPTEGKVKKSLFDILSGAIAGVNFLDLFAGSGAVGIEALSRGAARAVFVDKDKACCEAIEENLNKIKQNAEVINTDTDRALDILSNSGNKVDIIFIDPPYYSDLTKKTLQKISACDILSPCALVIVQHYKKDDCCESIGKLTRCKIKKYGDTVLSFFEKEGKNV